MDAIAQTRGRGRGHEGRLLDNYLKIISKNRLAGFEWDAWPVLEFIDSGGIP
jgi:hypothetical protein